jgi:signal transduction histidine kinase
LSNALKFTDRDGTITVGIKILDHQLKKHATQEELDSRLMKENHKSVSKIIQEDFDKYFQNQNIQKDKMFYQNEERFVQLQLSVIDTGIGISEEGLNKLFIDFSKLDESSKRNTSGTGLGLSICKNIIEEMGGKVTVQSTLGKGTKFHINLKTHCLVKLVAPEFENEQGEKLV